MEYEDSICCLEAEQDIIWDKNFLYKRNVPHKYNTTVLTPEEEEMDIPF
jgi:hypothetical protein